MKLALMADLHGQLPEVPDCDIAVVAGDICPGFKSHVVERQYDWLDTKFRRWLADKNVVATWGNHDWIGQKGQPPTLPWTLLVDERAEVQGLTFYGTPWQPPFRDWAFNLPELELAGKFNLVPTVDVLVSHGPPWGFGDLVSRGHVGSPSLLTAALRTSPRLHVFGHIHDAAGTWKFRKTKFVNAALLNEQYALVRKPCLVSLSPRSSQARRRRSSQRPVSPGHRVPLSPRA